MKRILLALAFTLTLQADSGIRFTEQELRDLGIALIECYDRHPILAPQAREVLAYANDVVKYQMKLTPDLFEKAVFETGAFRKNIQKLCGTYNGDIINEALAVTGWDVERTYELLGYFAEVGIRLGDDNEKELK